MIPKTSEAENITTHYLILLQGAYRALYILNWIYRYSYEHFWDPIAIIGAVVQVCFSTWALHRVVVIHADTKGSPTPSISPRIIQHMLFFLRFMQLAATTVNGFIFCYLVWSHNNHYCAWYPQSCTLQQKEWAQVPWQFILMITVVRHYCQWRMLILVSAPLPSWKITSLQPGWLTLERHQSASTSFVPLPQWRCFTVSHISLSLTSPA